jgi:hypothetical protein
MRLAPSSIEYSEWQCKCAKGVTVKELLPYVLPNGRRDQRRPRPSPVLPNILGWGL